MLTQLRTSSHRFRCKKEDGKNPKKNGVNGLTYCTEQRKWKQNNIFFSNAQHTTTSETGRCKRVSA